MDTDGRGAGGGTGAGREGTGAGRGDTPPAGRTDTRASGRTTPTGTAAPGNSVRPRASSSAFGPKGFADPARPGTTPAGGATPEADEDGGNAPYTAWASRSSRSFSALTSTRAARAIATAATAPART
ncbi:hypothetical protein DQ384_21465 [Sphaerisporangium album]|uniref:Uncharacterized protein n=1 Tax=Sphaerisporangium album TaxID=509200 RepID=A0A367FGV9_9ACTN|nr:hypothetical protein DQ384_21465 [Sphaerisporangium album]